jgi:hypothetical protein
VRNQGGLKLALRPAGRDDRRGRFARVRLEDAQEKQVALVTDSRGRMRYSLATGAYRLHVDDREIPFEVRDGRWTRVWVDRP